MDTDNIKESKQKSWVKKKKFIENRHKFILSQLTATL